MLAVESALAVVIECREKLSRRRRLFAPPYNQQIRVAVHALEDADESLGVAERRFRLHQQTVEKVAKT